MQRPGARLRCATDATQRVGTAVSDRRLLACDEDGVGPDAVAQRRVLVTRGAHVSPSHTRAPPHASSTALTGSATRLALNRRSEDGRTCAPMSRYAHILKTFRCKEGRNPSMLARLGSAQPSVHVRIADAALRLQLISAQEEVSHHQPAALA